MRERAKQSEAISACPAPVVLFGIDSRGKPKAARFGKQHAGLAVKAATQLQLQVLVANDPKIADLTSSAAGRPGPCDRPNLCAICSPRSLRSGFSSGRQCGCPRGSPVDRVVGGVRFSAKWVGASLAERLAGDRA